MLFLGHRPKPSPYGSHIRDHPILFPAGRDGGGPRPFGEGAVSTVELALCLQIGVCTMPGHPLSSLFPQGMPEPEGNTNKLIDFLTMSGGP
jgi:hypothetical protein